MSKVIAFVKREPVRVYSALLALLAVGGAFGLDLTAEQTGAIAALAAVILGIGEGVRSQVTPTSKLK